MKVLLTGATGHTGRRIAEILTLSHEVRGVTFRGVESARQACSCRDIRQADITDYAVCRSLLEGMEAMVLCHMAPNPEGYKIPPPGFDINVKGTANLYHAAAEAGIKKAVLISTLGVLSDPPKKTNDAEPGVGPYNFNQSHHGLYSLTKIFQEGIARYYFFNYQIATAVMRPSWIVDERELLTKYGEKMDRYHSTLIDPRDIGSAVVAALALPDLKLESFNIGQPDLPADMTAAKNRLRWSARYHFPSLPRVNDGN